MARARGTILTLMLALSLPVSGWPAAGGARPAPHPALDSKNQTPSAAVPREPGIRRVETSEKVIALTLDDGPDPKYTPLVLELARKHHIALTFFVTGEHVRLYPELARRIVAEGHVIGNHTWSHKIMLGLSESEDVAEIEACGGEIEKVCGRGTRLFRPPKGRVDDNVARAAAALGYQVVLWSVAVEHRDATTPQAMAQRVIQRVHPGSIVLAHDYHPRQGGGGDRTVAALAIIVVELEKQGYRFVTVPELLALAPEKPAACQRKRG
jgi:peptidoglycan/xylan/chitin deacetylase (PgdA/CDA1 family)